MIRLIRSQKSLNRIKFQQRFFRCTKDWMLLNRISRFKRSQNKQQKSLRWFDKAGSTVYRKSMCCTDKEVSDSAAEKVHSSEASYSKGGRRVSLIFKVLKIFLMRFRSAAIECYLRQVSNTKKAHSTRQIDSHRSHSVVRRRRRRMMIDFSF